MMGTLISKNFKNILVTSSLTCVLGTVVIYIIYRIYYIGFIINKIYITKDIYLHGILLYTLYREFWYIYIYTHTHKRKFRQLYFI